MANYLDSQYSGYLGRAGQPEYLPMYDFLSNYLREGAEGGMPFRDQLRQNAEGTIRRQYDKAGRDLSSNLSSRGIGGSGISLVAQNELQTAESGALNEATANLNQQDIGFRQNSIAQLLGLSQAQGSYFGQQRGQGLDALGQLTGYNQFEQELGEKRRLSNLAFWGSLLEGAGSASGGYLGGPKPG